jgi:acyl carrier protein
VDTLTRLHDYVRREIAGGTTPLEPGENLLRRGILDSMGLLKLVTFLEETYGFETTGDDIVPENFGTLEKIRDFVERKRAR